MYNGGVTISDRTAQIIRTAGLIVPISLLLYGVLVQYSIVDASHFSSDAVFYMIIIPWLAIALWQFFTPPPTTTTSVIRLTAYHIFAAAFVLFVAGFTMPFVVAWILLLIASQAYFGRKGLWCSIIALTAAVFIDAVLYWPDRSIVIADILATIAILIVGLSAVAITRSQEIDSIELTRSKAQETLQRDRILTIVNNLADAVMSTDKNGIVKVFNAASLNLLDTNVSLNGHFIDDIIKIIGSDEKPVSLFELLKDSHSVVTRDDLTMSLEGEELRLEVTYSPIRSSYSRSKKAEAQDGYVLILRDVTKAKSLEEERDEFISVVSHELRTPITVAEGTISNVQVMMERPGIPEATLKEGIETAHEQILYLAKMVNDLSTLSRAERGVADQPEVINVRGLVDDLYNEYLPQAKKKGLRFDLDLDSRLGQVTASPLYLKELLQNFLSNSLKYTKEGSITLKVTRKGDKITFAIKDTGIGISKSDQTKIFHKFYRSEDYRTRETSGTGLGLYVSAKLAKKLGTKIDLTSRLNHGSTFSFTLPVED